jgi:hypothetical protein
MVATTIKIAALPKHYLTVERNCSEDKGADLPTTLYASSNGSVLLLKEYDIMTW